MRRDYLYGLGAVLLWATTAPVVKTVLRSLPNLEALCLSAALAGLCLLLAALRNRGPGRLRGGGLPALGRTVGVGFVGMFLYSALYYRGLSLLSAQEACVLNYLWPMMLLALSIPLLGSG